MAPPPIALFMTTIASQPVLRQRQEYILRTLQVKKIPFTTYDLASDEEAKRLWRRKAPKDKQQLPGLLVGQKFPGTYDDFEDAVEHDELDIFLRRNESWDPTIDEDRPMPVAQPVGVPGAASPLQMTPDHLKSKIYNQHSTPTPSPLSKKVPVNKRTNEFDVGDELTGFGLQGVKVTQEELWDLMAELGLDDKGRGGAKSKSTPEANAGNTKPLKSKLAKAADELDAAEIKAEEKSYETSSKETTVKSAKEIEEAKENDKPQDTDAEETTTDQPKEEEN